MTARCLLLALLLAGSTRGAERSRFFVTIPPQRWLVRQLAGDGVDVEVLVQPGQNPHTFEPTGRQLALLVRSRGWFTIGLPFEPAILAKARRMQRGLTEMPMHRGVHRLVADAAGHGGAAHACGSHDCGDAGADPHVWLSPLAMAQLGTNTCQALGAILPERASELNAALDRLTASLLALQEELTVLLRPVQGRGFWVYHPSWGYFAAAFGLKQQAVEQDGREPSARQLASLVTGAQRARARVLFADPQFDPQPIQTLARQINARVERIDPLAEDWATNLKQVAEAVLRAARE